MSHKPFEIELMIMSHESYINTDIPNTIIVKLRDPELVSVIYAFAESEKANIVYTVVNWDWDYPSEEYRIEFSHDATELARSLERHLIAAFQNSRH